MVKRRGNERDPKKESIFVETTGRIVKRVRFKCPVCGAWISFKPQAKTKIAILRCACKTRFVYCRYNGEVRIISGGKSVYKKALNSRSYRDSERTMAI